MSLWPFGKNERPIGASMHETPRQVVPLTKDQRFELRKAMDAIEECDEILANLLEETAKRKAVARDQFWVTVSSLTGVPRYEGIQRVNWVACQIEIFDNFMDDNPLTP